MPTFRHRSRRLVATSQGRLATLTTRWSDVEREGRPRGKARDRTGEKRHLKAENEGQGGASQTAAIRPVRTQPQFCERGFHSKDRGEGRGAYLLPLSQYPSKRHGAAKRGRSGPSLRKAYGRLGVRSEPRAGRRRQDPRPDGGRRGVGAALDGFGARCSCAGRRPLFS